MLPLQIKENIYDVSVQDWDVRDFHGYKTERGATYNSYLIMDEKICLIDTVKAPFAEELINNIRSVTDPAQIDYIVINHVEPDHSGAMPVLAKLCPKAKFIITMQGKTEAVQHYGDIFDFIVAKDGDTLELGKRTLQFATMPMLHWPDSMATYSAYDKILFSNDAFGQHYATSKRFDDEVELDVLYYEAKKYFANILWPYAKLIDKAIAKLGGLDFDLIAPSHGVIWRSHLNDIINMYQQWGSGVKDGSIVVAYDSMWGGTEKIARAIAKGVAKAGVEVKLFKVSCTENSSIAAELFTASGFLVGSSTLNYGMLPSVGALLTYVKGLKPMQKKAAAFGTFGWAGGAQKDMEEFLNKAGFNVFDGYTCKWKPQAAELETAEKFGYEFAQNLDCQCER